MALVPPDEALIVDLADIYFETGPSEPLTLFREGYKAVVPVFESSEAHYSYLLYEEGAFKMAAEKQVISNLASAGVYMFSSSKTFVDCAGWSIENRDKVSWANNLFICPMINALVHEKKSVTSPFLEKVRPVGKIFHL
jgi:dTDP-glucose pyrophosphorylase